MSKQWVAVLGATSFVGECLFPLILDDQCKVLAVSRQTVAQDDPCIVWRDPDRAFGDGTFECDRIEKWVCAAPIWVLPDYFDRMASLGVRRIVALSSTSRYTKEESSDLSEQETVKRMIAGENRLQQWAEANDIEWIILRPTMIYGLGRDKNLAEVARFIRRFGLFPLFGKANGLRQPIHVQDLAKACYAILKTHGIANRAYNLSGGEILSYREMISRVFAALGRPPRMLPVPLSVFRVAVAVLRFLPRYRYWTAAMAERMNRDLVFDHSDAAVDLAFKSRAFILSSEDVAI